MREKDRVLKLDETPVTWRMSEQERQVFGRWAARLDWQRLRRMAAFERACVTRRLNWQARLKQLKLFDPEEL